MSERYFFSEENVVWSESHESTLDYTDPNSTLSDTIGYVTAIEDTDNETTQYLSILETSSDITLEDLQNLTLNNSIGVHENLILTEASADADTEVCTGDGENLMNVVDVDGQQVVVFSVDGSDDLFGIQLAEDEMGNIQKYQFKFRTNEEGQLEAIPESIALLVNEDEIQPEQEIFSEDTLIQAAVDAAVNDALQDKEPEGLNPRSQSSDQDFDNLEHADSERADCLQVYIKGEQHSPMPDIQEENSESRDQDDDIFEENVEYRELEESQHESEDDLGEEVDVKTDILQQNLALVSPESKTGSPKKQREIKAEMFNEDSQHFDDSNVDPFAPEENLQSRPQGHFETASTQTQNITTILEYQNYGNIGHFLNSGTQPERTHGTDHYEEVYVQENIVSGANKGGEDLDDAAAANDSEEYVQESDNNENDNGLVQTNDVEVENDSDNEDYHVVNGVHITGDIEGDLTTAVSTDNEPILRELLEKPSIEPENVLIENPAPGIKKIREVRNRKTSKVLYYVVYPEKENVNAFHSDSKNVLLLQKTKAPNPRSVLKSSFPTADITTNLVKSLNDERYNKRFAKSKEAMQAKQFHNFISTTTIPHAPVRQTRLPRKQAIKPVVERRDEEIIVQEVMVSSNGYIQDVGERLRNSNKLEVTAIVELTDSDEEYDPKRNNKIKKKTLKSRRHSDTNSDVSVIEILQSDEEEGTGWRETSVASPKKSRDIPKSSEPPEVAKDKDGLPLHRRRGRPPKTKSTTGNLEDSPTKKSRTESSEDTDIAQPEKTEIKCPHCTKTFPSQNSLNTHIQHHNLENSLKNLQKNSRQSSIPTRMLLQYNHKCDNCEQTFKNSILLSRHDCPKKPGFDCSICLKKFTDVTSLNIHKRIHVKANLVNSTSVAKVSPKKFTRPSTSTFKSPKKSLYKCKECSKVCSSSVNLNVHSKSHKKFFCSTCPLTFSSRLLLDTHVRASCVKPKSPSNKRLSFKIRKSFMHTPPRISTVKSNKQITVPSVVSTVNETSFQLQCETCKKNFSTHRLLFTHKVQVHGLSTPDKSLMVKSRKTSLYKPRGAHSGIPANERMKKAYAVLKEKLEAKEVQQVQD